jgi:hypothetical protein
MKLALDADAQQGFPHVVQLERLDDCHDQFHVKGLDFSTGASWRI